MAGNPQFNGLLIVLLMLAVTACSSGPEDLIDPEPGAGQFPAHVPFVEDVQIPEHIVAGEIVTIQVTLSAEADPSILNGRGNSDRGGFHYAEIGEGSIKVYRIHLTLDPPSVNPDGPPNHTYEIETHFPVPGEYLLRILSTTTREKGGSTFTIVIPGGEFLADPYLTYKELPFTVEPVQ